MKKTRKLTRMTDGWKIVPPKKPAPDRDLLKVKGRSKKRKWVVDISHWRATSCNEIFCEIQFIQYDGKFQIDGSSLDCDSLAEAKTIANALQEAIEKAEQKLSQIKNH